MRKLNGITIDGEFLGSSVAINGMFRAICTISPVVIRDFIKIINKIDQLDETVKIYTFNCPDTNSINIEFSCTNHDGCAKMHYTLQDDKPLLTDYNIFLNDEEIEIPDINSEEKEKYESTDENSNIQDIQISSEESEIKEADDIENSSDNDKTIPANKDKEKETNIQPSENENFIEEQSDSDEINEDNAIDNSDSASEAQLTNNISLSESENIEQTEDNIEKSESETEAVESENEIANVETTENKNVVIPELILDENIDIDNNQGNIKSINSENDVNSQDENGSVKSKKETSKRKRNSKKVKHTSINIDDIEYDDEFDDIEEDGDDEESEEDSDEFELDEDLKNRAKKAKRRDKYTIITKSVTIQAEKIEFPQIPGLSGSGQANGQGLISGDSSGSSVSGQAFGGQIGGGSGGFIADSGMGGNVGMGGNFASGNQGGYGMNSQGQNVGNNAAIGQQGNNYNQITNYNYPMYPQGGMPYPQQGMPNMMNGMPPNAGGQYPQQGGMPYPQQGMQQYQQGGMPFPQAGMPYPQQGMPYPQGGMPYPPNGMQYPYGMPYQQMEYGEINTLREELERLKQMQLPPKKLMSLDEFMQTQKELEAEKEKTIRSKMRIVGSRERINASALNGGMFVAGKKVYKWGNPKVLDE